MKKNFFKKNFGGVAGLVLAEALMAVASLAGAVVVLGTIITNASSSTKVSQDYLLAQSLVKEAIAAVMNVRDTNWLRYSTEPNCWLAVGSDRDDNCVSAAVQAGLTSPEYIPVQESGVWNLFESPGEALDLDDGLDNYYVLYEEDGESKNALNDIGSETKFYRSIQFTEEGSETDATGNSIKKNAVFLVKVQWVDGSKVSKIERKTAIYNFGK